MIGAEASRALTLISGIKTCRQDEGIWRSVITRIVFDLDEQGQGVALCIVRAILAELWDELPDKGSAAPGSQAMLFHAVLIDVPGAGEHDGCCDLSLRKAVAVYLGDIEIKRIAGGDLVITDGQVIIDETVAAWLGSRLA